MHRYSVIWKVRWILMVSSVARKIKYLFNFALFKIKYRMVISLARAKNKVVKNSKREFVAMVNVN